MLDKQLLKLLSLNQLHDYLIEKYDFLSSKFTSNEVIEVGKIYESQLLNFTSYQEQQPTWVKNIILRLIEKLCIYFKQNNIPFYGLLHHDEVTITTYQSYPSHTFLPFLSSAVPEDALNQFMQTMAIDDALRYGVTIKKLNLMANGDNGGRHLRMYCRSNLPEHFIDAPNNSVLFDNTLHHNSVWLVTNQHNMYKDIIAASNHLIQQAGVTPVYHLPHLSLIIPNSLAHLFSCQATFLDFNHPDLTFLGTLVNRWLVFSRNTIDPMNKILIYDNKKDNYRILQINDNTA